MNYLSNKNLYLKALSSAFDKRKKDLRIYKRTRKNQPSLNWLKFNSEVFCSQLKEEILSKKFTFDGAKLFEVKQGNKIRIMGQFSYKDFIFLKVLNNIFFEISKDSFCDNLFSYRKGFSREKALKSYKDFVSLHMKNMKFKKYGFYVYRADISAYGDNIPLGDNSDIWKLLDLELKQVKDNKEADILKYYFKKGIRMPIISPENFCYSKGMIFGSPLCNYVNNLYLNDLDWMFKSDCFYSRFGDDILFMHHDCDIFFEKVKFLKNFLASRKLKIKQEKETTFYFTGAGINCPKTNLKGCNKLKYLGFDLFFDGSFSLPSDKIKILLNDLDKRCERALNISKLSNVDNKGFLIAGIINNFLDNKIFSHKYFHLILSSTNSRSALKNLDYIIARRFLFFVLGNKSVKAFRKISYKNIKRKFKVKSLVELKNKK